VSACANFVVERTIDLVLFGTEDGCKVVSHGCLLSSSDDGWERFEKGEMRG
jgi:hypothetical protein